MALPKIARAGSNWTDAPALPQRTQAVAKDLFLSAVAQADREAYQLLIAANTPNKVAALMRRYPAYRNEILQFVAAEQNTSFVAAAKSLAGG